MSSAAAAAAGMSSPLSPTSTTPGGRRRTTHPTYKSENDALDQIAKEAEDRLAARRRAREEARAIRMKELERQQKEAEEQMDKEFVKKSEDKKNLMKHQTGGPTVPGTSYTPSSSTLLTSATPRRGSNDVAGQENLKDMDSDDDKLSAKDLLADLDEKYKKAMMTNAQLDNEKATLIFEVDSMKDTLEEQEEVMMELQRETRDKHRELEAKKRENGVLSKDVGTLREMVSQRDQLISEHGLLVVGDEDDDLPEGQRSSKKNKNKVGTIVVVSSEAAELLEVAGDGPLDVRLKHFVEERKELLEEVRKLRIDLEEERSRSERRRGHPSPVPAENGPDLHEMMDTQTNHAYGKHSDSSSHSSDKDSGRAHRKKKSKERSHEHSKDGHKHDKEGHSREMGRQVQEYKFKLTRTEQEVTTLEGSVLRLEGQVKRYKTAAEQAEEQEEELKAERRKLTRENRSLKEKLDETETENGHLLRRLEKLKSTRLTVK